MSTQNKVPYPLRDHCTKELWADSAKFREALLVIIREKMASRVKAGTEMGDLVMIRSLLTNEDLEIL